VLTNHDHLTGLMNRSLLKPTFQQANVATDFSHRVLGLIVADIDDFKSINDEYGHDVSDEVLQTFAGLLNAQDRLGQHAFASSVVKSFA
jgi:diguanylate cyclase (GGDEF)-like protein